MTMEYSTCRFSEAKQPVTLSGTAPAEREGLLSSHLCLLPHQVQNDGHRNTVTASDRIHLRLPRSQMVAELLPFSVHYESTTTP